MKRYKVTCLKCKSSESIPIDTNRNLVAWEKVTRIISARFRLDNKWGFQCLCGNNNLLTKQEDEKIKDKQNPDPKDISYVVKNLKPDNRKLFEMREM